MLDVCHGAARIDQLRPLLTRQGFFERLLKGEVHCYDDNTNMMSSGCEKISHKDASDQED